jgi:hypothetical protein
MGLGYHAPDSINDSSESMKSWGRFAIDPTLAAYRRKIHELSPCTKQIPAVGVDHDLAKVGVEGSNPFARSKYFNSLSILAPGDPDA